MAGYDDELARNYDKSKMIEVPPEVMRGYAGGDTDACLRLCRNLMKQLQQNPKHYKRYTHVVMPSLAMFAKVTEPYGVAIDTQKLEELKASLLDAEQQMYADLLTEAPANAKKSAILGGFADLGSRTNFCRFLPFAFADEVFKFFLRSDYSK